MHYCGFFPFAAAYRWLTLLRAHSQSVHMSRSGEITLAGLYPSTRTRIAHGPEISCMVGLFVVVAEALQYFGYSLT
jgi:hypothetical protein